MQLLEVDWKLRTSGHKTLNTTTTSPRSVCRKSVLFTTTNHLFDKITLPQRYSHEYISAQFSEEVTVFHERLQPSTSTMRVLLLLCLALPAFGADVDQRVIGGRNALIGTFPYTLSFREDGTHICAASLISTTRAVTGAFCTGAAIGVYTVLGGTADRTVTNCATCVLRDLNFLVTNPFYDEGGNGRPNDVAVIGFPAVTFNENLQAAVLATPSGGDFTGASCTIVGWGRANPGGNLQTDLQQGDVTALSSTDCEQTWGNFQINAGHLCSYASDVTGCAGDEGGPLVCSDTVAGIASWGDETCNLAYPYVYSRVSYFYGWIIAQ